MYQHDANRSSSLLQIHQVRLYYLGSLNTFPILLLKREQKSALAPQAGTGGSNTHCGWGSQPSPKLHMGIQSWKRSQNQY